MPKKVTLLLQLLQEQILDQDLDSVAHNNIQRIHQDLIPQGHTRLNQHREQLIVVRRQQSAETSCRRTTKDLEVRSGAVACARSKESRSVSVSPIPHTQAAPVKGPGFL